MVLLLLGLVSIADPAGGSSCGGPRNDAEAIENSTVTVEGEAGRWTPGEGNHGYLDVRVRTALKGPVEEGETLRLFTNRPAMEDDGLSIPWRYELGANYRIYAHETDVGLATGGCSGNRAVPSAAVSSALPLPAEEGDANDDKNSLNGLWLPLVAGAIPLLAVIAMITRQHGARTGEPRSLRSQ